MRIPSTITILLLFYTFLNLQNPIAYTEGQNFPFEGSKMVYDVEFTYYFPVPNNTGANIKLKIESSYEIVLVNDSSIIIKWEDKGNTIWPSKADEYYITWYNTEEERYCSEIVSDWVLYGKDVLFDREKVDITNGTLLIGNKSISRIDELLFIAIIEGRSSGHGCMWYSSVSDTYTFCFIDKFSIGSEIVVGDAIVYLGGLDLIETPIGERDCVYANFERARARAKHYSSSVHPIWLWNATYHWDRETGVLVKLVCETRNADDNTIVCIEIWDLKETNVFDKLEFEGEIEQENMTEPIPTIEEETIPTITPLETPFEIEEPIQKTYFIGKVEMIIIVGIIITLVAIVVYLLFSKKNQIDQVKINYA
ncbi:hypothetical protein [[Eubacterium] cellulosolvens]